MKKQEGAVRVNAAERRERIRQILGGGTLPVSAGALAKQLQVSRQIIVGDVALLRAANVPIEATPRGYVLRASAARGGIRRTVACRHDLDGMRRELYAVVDNGCGMLDVIVEHPVYGQISGQLQIFSRFDADDFMEKLTGSGSLPLCDLTEGVHLHTLSCPTEEAYRRVLQKLKEEDVLFGKDSQQT